MARSTRLVMLIQNIFTLCSRNRCKLPTEIIMPHCDFSVINNFFWCSLLFRDFFSEHCSLPLSFVLIVFSCPLNYYFLQAKVSKVTSKDTWITFDFYSGIKTTIDLVFKKYLYFFPFYLSWTNFIVCPLGQISDLNFDILKFWLDLTLLRFGTKNWLSPQINGKCIEH